MKRFILVLLAIILVSALIFTGCTKPAPTPTPAPAPSPAPAPTPAPKPAPAPTPAPAPFPPALQQVIETAKKEGKVSFQGDADYGTDVWPRAEKEIKEMFGVDLKINFVPAASGARTLTQILTEKKSGMTPENDIIDFTPSRATAAVGGGAIEKVDWRALLTKDHNPDVVLDFAGVQWLTMKTQGSGGVVYNPEKVSENELPKTLMELATNTKWKGKIGYVSYTGVWARWARQDGKEQTFNAIRAMQANGAFIGTNEEIYNRFLLGEVWFLITQDFFVAIAERDGVPAAWQHLTYYSMDETIMSIPYGAQNQNAAKLFGLYMASPGGVKFTYDVSRQGSYLYPGNFEYDSIAKAKKSGVKVMLASRDPAEVAFGESKEYVDLQAEIKLVLEGK